MLDLEADLPKRIWTLWLQGPEQMPELVQACIESWRVWNPDWEMNVLTAHTLGDFTDPVIGSPRALALPPARFADFVRTDLLRRHGGVWVDATCFCMRSLEDWLPSCFGSGFFAFAAPMRERLLSSWFLASGPDGYVVRRLWEELCPYYLGHPLRDEDWRRTVRRQLQRVLNRSPRTTGLWFAPPLPQLGIFPPGQWHHMFARLTRRDPRFAEIWNRTPKVSAPDGPVTLQNHGLDKPPSEQIVADIEQRRHPVYKLNWRIDPAELPESSTLNFLLRHAAPT